MAYDELYIISSGKRSLLADLFPKQWRKGDAFVDMGVHLICYQFVPEQQPDANKKYPFYSIIGNFFFYFFQGDIEYFAEADLNIVDSLNKHKKITETGSFVIISERVENYINQVHTFPKKNRLKGIAGLLSYTLGSGVVKKYMFYNHYGISSDNRYFITDNMKKIHYADIIPDFSMQSLGGFVVLLEYFNSKITESEKNIFSLSLQWYTDAISDNNLNSFLKYWIAIDIINDREKRNGKHKFLVKMASYYQIESDKVEDRLNYSLIRKLRNTIMHEGLNLTLDFRFISYCHYLYLDIFSSYIGIIPETKHIDAFKLYYSEFNVKSYLEEKMGIFNRPNL